MDEASSQSIAILQALSDGVRELCGAAAYLPTVGSMAACELSQFPNKDFLETAYSQGTMYLDVAFDHASAYTKTLKPPIQTVAPWTITRAVLESAALSSWLLDVCVDPKERVSRSMALRYEGLCQQLKLINSVGDPAALRRVSDRMDYLEQQALSLGYSQVLDRKGRRIGVGQEMSKATDLIENTLCKGTVYRILSGAAHSHSWALNHLSFQPRTDVGPTETPMGVKVTFVTRALSPEQVHLLSCHVASSIAPMVWRKFKLFGLDHQTLSNLLERTYDNLAIRNPEQRFWKRDVSTPT